MDKDEYIAKLIKAGNNLYSAMRMQMHRENETFHITAEVALAIWLEALTEWNQLFGKPEVTKDNWQETTDYE